MIRQINIDSETDGDNKVWRYIDFAKFYSLITTRSLFLCRSVYLPDEFEGSYSKENIAETSGYGYMRYGFGRYGGKSQSRVVRFSNEELRARMNICCFHMSEVESSAMWELYTIERQGIALQSTVKRLREAMDDSSNIAIGKVKYRDYNDGKKIDETSEFQPFLFKRMYFQHEKELRVLLLDDVQNGDSDEKQFGRYLPVNLDSLIEKIYVSPKSPTWFRELIEHSLRENNLDCSVKQSDLDMTPIRV